jgi:Kef-type K+ transport system membrane component KefB
MQHLLTSLLLLIVSARFLGELMVRLKQPRIIGEIIAGILLGPAFFNLVEPSENLEGIAQLSVFLIVLSAGLEMEFKDVISSVVKRGLPATFVDFLIPLGLGVLVGTLFGQGRR